MLKEYAEYKELGAQIVCYFSKMEKENINSDEEAEIKKEIRIQEEDADDALREALAALAEI